METVNEAITARELEAVHTSVRRSRPFGSPTRQARTAARLGLTHTMRSEGRPRKERRRSAARQRQQKTGCAPVPHSASPFHTLGQSEDWMIRLQRTVPGLISQSDSNAADAVLLLCDLLGVYS